MQYTYDRDSNRLSRINLINALFTEGYGYDNLNQLTSFMRGSRSQSWGLDIQGNWSTFTNDSSTQTRTHNLQNQVTSITGATTPGYDANGNTLVDETGKQFVYDAWNRLVQVNDSTGTTRLESYAYDALNRRMSVSTGSTTTGLYYSSSWQVVEEQVAGAMTAQYVWSPVYVDALIERDTPSGGRLYVQQDANWNVTAVLGYDVPSATWQVQERYVYDPYGQASFYTAGYTMLGGSALGWIYLHQGGRYDSTSGLYWFRNRDYSPTLGRWMQQDPIGYRDGPSLYDYVNDSPDNHLDPTGLTWNDLVNLFRYPSEALQGARQGARNLVAGGLRAAGEGGLLATDVAAMMGQTMVRVVGIERDYTPYSSFMRGLAQTPDPAAYLGE